MPRYYADLHVHLGWARGGPVKVSASPRLTFENVVAECRYRKGIEIIGIVDCQARGVLAEIIKMHNEGEVREQEGGGLRYGGVLTVILGAEVETVESNGRAAHFISYLPDLDAMSRFSSWLARHVTNPFLSSQRSDLRAAELLEKTVELGGVLVPAHAFTPHKGLFGSVVDCLGEAFPPAAWDHLFALELGLSADTRLALRVPGADRFTFLSNSDAHSLASIGREYNLIEAEGPTFRELVDVLRGRKGRVVANYGLDPRLGKYHRSRCLECGTVAEGSPPVLSCLSCGSDRVVVGVLDRVEYLHHLGCREKGPVRGGAPHSRGLAPDPRPPYHYQVPLAFVPGVGPRTVDKLIKTFGSEMAVLHETSCADLETVVGSSVARMIVAAREGRLGIAPGGGGYYGRVQRPRA